MSRLLSTQDALLLVIDIQEKFRPVLFNAKQVIENAQRLISGCNHLGVPVLVSEQYPQGLGHTAAELNAVLSPATPVIEKSSFGCCDEPNIMAQFHRLGRRQIMICGLETHICVNQTVTRLLEEGYQVYLIEDALGSRTVENYQIGLRKMTQLGAISSCTEMALFELLRGADHPQFKTIQQLVK